MPLTHFPYGMSTFGYPVLPPIPFMADSRYYYADVVNGADLNSGTDPSQPLQTIAKGFALLRSGHYDTLFVIGLGTAFTLGASLNWNKDYTNLVGITAPIDVSQRARITTGVATMTPAINFSGTGITVKNLQIINFGSDATLAAVGVSVTGQRSYFENVQFAGGADGAAVTRAGTAMRSLVVDGGGGNGEHLFYNCLIGLDTVDTAGANYELELKGNTPRNRFNDCSIIKRVVSGGAGGGFINFPATGIDRWTIFDRLTATNFTIGGGVALTTAFNIIATTGVIIMRDPITTGATGLSGGAKTNFLTNNDITATTVGLGLEPSS